MLGQDNWQLGRRICCRRRSSTTTEKGEYREQDRRLAATASINWEPEFDDGDRDERTASYIVNADGTIVDKATGKQPPFVYGFPFPDIDANDPQAGVKILWNFVLRLLERGQQPQLRCA